MRKGLTLSICILLVAIIGLVGPASVLLAQDCDRPVFGGVEQVTWGQASGNYTLTWSAAIDPGDITYHVLASTESNFSRRQAAIFSGPKLLITYPWIYAGSVVGETSAVVTGLDPNLRYYFFVRAQNEKGLLDKNFVLGATRTLNLQGAANARDLGGYVTSEGFTVKWGKIYRAGHFATLSPLDILRLDNLGLQRIIDQRTDLDKMRDGLHDPADPRANFPNLKPWDPTTWPGHDMIYDPAVYDIVPFNQGDPYLSSLAWEPHLWNPAEADLRHYNILLWSMSWDLTEVDFDNWYVNLLEENKDEIKQVFDRLADPDQYPIVFHCTQGKDRAGVVSALLLSLLGVSPQAIMQDYALTALITQDQIQATLEQIGGLWYASNNLTPGYEWAYGLMADGVTMEHWTKMISVHLPAMQNLLGHLHSSYGGVGNFLKSIGVSSTQQNTIKALLVDKF